MVAMLIKVNNRKSCTIASKEYFEYIKLHNVRLNQPKCIFGVKSTILWVNECRIEVNHRKLRENKA